MKCRIEEYHQVTRIRRYEITEEDFKIFQKECEDEECLFKGTWDEFQKIDRENLQNIILHSGYFEGYEDKEDWWQDLKGGYDIEIFKEDENGEAKRDHIIVGFSGDSTQYDDSMW